MFVQLDLYLPKRSADIVFLININQHFASCQIYGDTSNTAIK